MMKNKYRICELQVCPFDITKTEKGKFYKADRNDFPYRLCVLDEESKKAIDVELETSYDYIEMSTLYFLENEAKKIVEGKRYAILPLPVSKQNYKKIEKANGISRRLSAGEDFIDGNVYDNLEYLALLNKDNKKKIKRK